MGADCIFIRVHNGVPVDMKGWDYMGNRVADLFTYHKIGEKVYDGHNIEVSRLTLEDWNRAIKERKQEVHMDSDDMFLLDWSAPGEWFIVITW